MISKKLNMYIVKRRKEKYLKKYRKEKDKKFNFIFLLDFFNCEIWRFKNLMVVLILLILSMCLYLDYIDYKTKLNLDFWSTIFGVFLSVFGIWYTTIIFENKKKKEMVSKEYNRLLHETVMGFNDLYAHIEIAFTYERYSGMEIYEILNLEYGKKLETLKNKEIKLISLLDELVIQFDNMKFQFTLEENKILYGGEVMENINNIRNRIIEFRDNNERLNYQKNLEELKECLAYITYLNCMM